MKIAFSRSKGNNILHKVWNYGVSLWTFGPYTHCEIIDENGSNDPNSWTWMSAGIYENGVRAHRIMFKSDHWDIYEIDIPSPEKLIGFFNHTENHKYDWLGLLLTQFIDLDRHAVNKWFCSEWVRESIAQGGTIAYDGKSHRYSPNKLYKSLKESNILGEKYV